MQRINRSSKSRQRTSWIFGVLSAATAVIVSSGCQSPSASPPRDVQVRITDSGRAVEVSDTRGLNRVRLEQPTVAASAAAVTNGVGNDETGQLESRLAELRRQIEVANNERSAMAAEISNQRREVAAERDSLAATQTETQAAERRLESKRCDITASEQALQVRNDELAALDADFASLKEANLAAITERDDLAQVLIGQHAEHERLAQVLAQLSQDILDASNSLAERRQDLESIKSRLDDARERRDVETQQPDSAAQGAEPTAIRNRDRQPGADAHSISPSLRDGGIQNDSGSSDLSRVRKSEPGQPTDGERPVDSSSESSGPGTSIWISIAAAGVGLILVGTLCAVPIARHLNRGYSLLVDVERNGLSGESVFDVPRRHCVSLEETGFEVRPQEQAVASVQLIPKKGAMLASDSRTDTAIAVNGEIIDDVAVRLQIGDRVEFRRHTDIVAVTLKSVEPARAA